MGPTLFGVPAPAPSPFLLVEIGTEWTSSDPRASFFNEIHYEGLLTKGHVQEEDAA